MFHITLDHVCIVDLQETLVIQLVHFSERLLERNATVRSMQVKYSYFLSVQFLERFKELRAEALG